MMSLSNRFSRGKFSSVQRNCTQGMNDIVGARGGTNRNDTFFRDLTASQNRLQGTNSQMWFVIIGAISVLNMLETCSMRNIKSLAGLCLVGAVLGTFVFLLDEPAFAESPKTTILKLDDETSLERTVTVMSIPEDNLMPWGAVRGKVDNPSQGYPVIIQFFKSVEDDPVHVAQVDLKGDNSFEYRFRMLSIDDGIVTHFYTGDYTVKIFKVIDTTSDVEDDLDTI